MNLEPNWKIEVMIVALLGGITGLVLGSLAVDSNWTQGFLLAIGLITTIWRCALLRDMIRTYRRSDVHNPDNALAKP